MIHFSDDYLAQMKTRSPFIPGPAALSFAPAAASLIGGVIGGGQANKAADQASQAQNQLTQQQLQIYQQMMQQYEQNVQPLQNPLSTQYQGTLNSINAPQTAATDINALLNPNQATGIPLQGITNNVLSYLANPQGTNLQNAYSQVSPGLLGGAAGRTNLGAQTPGLVQQIQDSAAGAAGVGQGVLSSDASALPQFLQQLDQSVTGNGTGGGVGAGALQYYLNQAQNGGLAPDLINSALGQQETSNAQNINNIRNSLGGKTNVDALIGDQGIANEQATAQLISQLTGQSQQLRTQAEGSALSAGQSIDAQTQQQALNKANTQLGFGTQALGAAGQNNTIQSGAATSALGAAGNLDAQSLQYMIQALSAGGGLDAQTLKMLTGEYDTASGAQQTQLGNINQANSTSQGLLSQIQNYLAQQQQVPTNVASGIGGVAKTYGDAASTAASSAAANNPFTSLGASLASNKYITGPAQNNNQVQ